MLKKLIREKIYTPACQEACPRCHSFSIYTRKTVAPKHRCIRCGDTFDHPSIEQTSSVSKEDWKDFQRKYRERIKEIVDLQRQKEVKDYMALKDGVILCKRCHFAKEKGRVLCKVCKTRYHKPEYEQCFECFKKTERGQEVARSHELLPYNHPWCGKSFQIKRQDWDIEAQPHQCCMDKCDLGPNLCGIAKEHWEEDGAEE